jgi:3',5'-nucleoside bisphosphate phosphatase
MPRRQPFTALCTRLAQLARPRRADLHVHTTASDGEFTPSQVVALARQANLAAVAVTDHDTLAAVGEARAAAGDQEARSPKASEASPFEVVPGVEITAGFNGRELHLLGYFVRTDYAELNAALARLCERRRERFRDFVAKLADRGTRLPDDRVKLIEESSPSLGRRHVAGLLLAGKFAQNRNEAFHRFLGPLAGSVLPKLLLPVEEAIHLVREAGGVTSLAHPPADLTEADFRALAGCGLSALEAEYPWGRNSPAARLREAAARLGLAITGGSDCHGPDPPHRRIGSHAITSEELEALRDRRDRPGSCASRN